MKSNANADPTGTPVIDDAASSAALSLLSKASDSSTVDLSATYKTLLNDTTPALRQYDPNAKLVAFAGTPLTGTMW